MKAMLKFQMLAAVSALAVGIIACSEKEQVTDEPDASDSEYMSDPKTVRIYGEIDPVATPDASGGTVQTRALDDSNYNLYENAKSNFADDDVVGFYSQGGNLQDMQNGTTGPFNNIPMTYSRASGTTSSFVSAPEAMDADVGNFGFKFIYWPYTENMADPGMEVRDTRGYTKDVLFAMRKSDKDLKFNFEHAFTLLSITRGEGFDNPKFDESKFTDEARKAYNYAKANYNLTYMGENDRFYMQVKLNEQIRYMSFPKEKAIEDPDTYAGLTQLKYYVDESSKDNTDWSVFDGFKDNGQVEDQESGTSYPCYTVLVPATYSEFFRDEKHSSSNPYYYKRMEIVSISLFDNEGEWVTVNDIQMIKYDNPDKFDGRQLRGGYRYPLTVAYVGLKPSVFPATIGKWDEEEWTEDRPAGINQDNFPKFIQKYNYWNDNRPIQESMLEYITTDLGEYANIKKKLNSETGDFEGVELTIFLSENIDASEHAGEYSSNTYYIERLYSADVFNGGGHTISDCHLTNGRGFIGTLEGTLTQLNLSGFTLNSVASDAVGVFCQTLAGTGQVLNCRADGVSIVTQGPVGAVAGTRQSGSIVNGCTVRGYLEGSNYDATSGSGESFSPEKTENNNFNGVYFQNIN